MKKAFLLSLLLVVAASAAITIEFPDGAPTTVGVPVRVIITSDAVESVDLFVNPGEETWVYPYEDIPLAEQSPTEFVYDGNVEITHDGTDLSLLAAKGTERGYSDTFDIVKGPVEKWQIIAPGETAEPGEADVTYGKSGPASVTAGNDVTYTISACDKWFNVVDAGSNEPELESDDDFAQLPDSPATGSNTIQLRTVEGTSGSQVHTVTVSGGSLEDMEASVTVSVGTVAKLLILCDDEAPLPGDTSTTPKASPVSYPGKTGQCANANTSSAYNVTVYAVDQCWNIVPTYDAIEVNVIGSNEGDLTTASVDAISSGVASNVPAIFASAHSQGEYISATDGSISTANDTKVIVSGGVSEVALSLNQNPVPPSVHSVLTVECFVGGVPAVVNVTITADDGVQILNDDWDLETNTSGVVTTQVWADQEGLYEIIGCSGGVCDTITLNVSSVQGLIAAPNPFKYSAETQSINFIYDVPEGGADEVMLLIVDPYGNIVYRATYTDGSPIASGQQSVTWNVMNSNDIRVASGMYQAVLRVKSGLSTTTNTKNIMVIW
jgi:hypothetical protein